ncbi:MAG: exopolysaccharide biosynthesis protein [Pseudomonadota bacterium]
MKLTQSAPMAVSGARHGKAMFQDVEGNFVAQEQEHRAAKPRALSQVLSELAQSQEGNSVSVACIRDALADRSFATMLALTCLFNLLPFPPGSTLVLGIPIVVVAVQMVAGRETVWLPKFFLNMSLSSKSFTKLTTAIIPKLRRLERIVRPRYWPFATRKSAERIIGIFALVFGVFVFIPLPFTNWLPALAGVICALALSERDGIWLLIGIAFGLISMAIIGTGYYMSGVAISGLF